MASGRPRRANAGAKMATMVDSMENDDSYKEQYGGSEEKMAGQKSTQAIESLCSKMSPQATFGEVKINYPSWFFEMKRTDQKSMQDIENPCSEMSPQTKCYSNTTSLCQEIGDGGGKNDDDAEKSNDDMNGQGGS